MFGLDRHCVEPSKAETATTVYLARHGRSEWNHQNRVTGQLDPGLSDVGRLQSRMLAQCLSGAAPAAIYASALRRTIDTARPVAALHGLPVQPVAALNEICMGALQGRYRDSRDAAAEAAWQRWQADPWTRPTADAESLADVADRACAWLVDALARHDGQTFLIVGHRATNSVLLGRLLGLPRSAWPGLGMRNKFCYRIVLGGPERVISTFQLSGDKAGTCRAGLFM